jgi:twitching motility protein PilJ
MQFNLLSKMKLWQKFALLGALGLAAVAVPYAQFYRTAQEGIDFAANELSGIAPTQNAAKLLQLVQLHRGLSGLTLSGVEDQTTARAAKQAEADQAILALDQQISQIEAKPVKDEWIAIKQEWKQLAIDVTTRATDSRKSFDSHTVLNTRILRLLDVLGDSSFLTLDPTAHTYFLVQAALVHLPQLTEQYGQMRGFGGTRLAESARLRATGADGAAAVSAADRTRMTALADNATASSELAYRFLAKAIATEPRLSAVLEGEMKQSQEAARQVLLLARKEIVDTPVPSFDPAKYVQSLTTGIDAQFKLQSLTSKALATELTAYKDSLRRNQLVISAQILGALLLVSAIAAFTVRNITGTVSSLQKSVEQVRLGDFNALQAIESKDEVGDLGRTVNELLQERITALNKSEKENLQLNDSVVGLLRTMFELSQRNLTVRAEVTSDVVGTVADSINMFADATSTALTDVTTVANQVADSTARVNTNAQVLSDQVQLDRQAVLEMTQDIAQTSGLMQQVAQLAEQSRAAAAQATSTTLAALKSVTTTVGEMGGIRESIGEMEKRVKRLGERSQEISQIVTVINSISERTHVLALNASMQAAMAGEAGRGFAVVTEEVQRLADASRNATMQIAQLAQNIQLETSETVAALNRTVTDVVKGSQVAESSGTQMRESGEANARLVEAVQRIADESGRQLDLAGRLAARAQTLSKSSEQTSAVVQQTANDAASLALSSERLVKVVSEFKLT